MKKFDVPIVAMAVLYRYGDLHSGVLTMHIKDSDLAVLGYKGSSPEKTIPSELRHLRKYRGCFIDGLYRSHFKLSNPAAVLDVPEVRVALFAILKQNPIFELWQSNAAEFTFIGSELAGVRHAQSLLGNQTPRIRKVTVPERISIGDLEESAGFEKP